MKCFCILTSAASLLRAVPAIAILATTLPAVALPAYTSYAPERVDITDVDVSPVLLSNTGTSRVYGSQGFVSHLADDMNLYVERFFVVYYDDIQPQVSIASLRQIDCGRGLVRSTSSTRFVNGEATRIGRSQWEIFTPTSTIAKTCEVAATSRGITWSWERAE